MEKKLGGLPMIVFTAACALAGFLLRTAQRGGSPAALIAVSAAAALALLAASFFFEKEREFAQVFGKNIADAAVSGVGALLLLLGCALSAWKNTGAGRYIGILGVVAALGLVRAAALRYGGAKPGDRAPLTQHGACPSRPGRLSPWGRCRRSRSRGRSDRP